ncbi:olfactory receptor 56A4-like [Lissotriton helveticus]
MLTVNTTSSMHISTLLLICFPGFQIWQHWLSIPLTLLYLLAMGANTMILAVIHRERQLHEPMYYLIALLAVLDLVLCTSTIPKTLGILCFGWTAIGVATCFLQMYIMNSFLASQSGAFLVMAFDRYTAICNPLRYSSVITNSFVAKAILFILVRNIFLGAAFPLLATRLHLCSSNVVENCICTVVSVASLACNDSTVNKVYQLSTGFILLGGDLICIFLSYCMILQVVLKLRAEGAAAKAFSTCTPHFILLSFFYTLLLVFIFSNTMEKKISPDVPILLNVLHLVLPPALNPIVYGLRTKEIKQGIIKMLGKGRTDLRVEENTTD